MASIELVTPLSRAICVERLRENVSEPFYGQGAVFGRVKESGFWIERRIGYRNSFKTRLMADLAEGNKGTRIVCRVGMQPIVFWFVSAWLVIVAGGLLFAIASAPAAAQVPLLMLICGAGILALGRYAARNEGKYLIDFLCSCLHARRNPPHSS
jgi:hypothetical protein